MKIKLRKKKKPFYFRQRLIYDQVVSLGKQTGEEFNNQSNCICKVSWIKLLLLLQWKPSVTAVRSQMKLSVPAWY